MPITFIFIFDNITYIETSIKNEIKSIENIKDIKCIKGIKIFIYRKVKNKRNKEIIKVEIKIVLKMK